MILDILNLFLGGFLGSLIVFTLGLYINDRFINYHKYLRAIRKLSFDKEYSFALLTKYLHQCVKYNPNCFNDINKFLKSVGVNSKSNKKTNGITEKDIKKCLICAFSNIYEYKDKGEKRNEN